MNKNLLEEVAEDAAFILSDALSTGSDPRRYRRLIDNLKELARRPGHDRCEKSDIGWHVLGPGMDAHVTLCRHCRRHFP